MSIDASVLEDAGLTKSEVKVYLALLKLGSSTKKRIVKEAEITPSKLYEVTDKLINKGLVSYIRKNSILHFSAAPPEQILDYLESQSDSIKDTTQRFSSLLPTLRNLQAEPDADVQVFQGWKGMRTAYNHMLGSLKPNGEYLVIGATEGEEPKKVAAFFQTIHEQRRKKRIGIKILVGREYKEWARKNLADLKLDHIRYVGNTSPSEVIIWGQTVMIVLLSKQPVVTIIKSQYVSGSFKLYFDQLWKSAEDG